ncbi:centromere kinetochore component CENP-T-domain-containing protein [Calycina marina]|uniref:Centromere kinetochore component CENP-T-domain-containing protein n=1 Tax=Calycina marina TaxID=1763456 RepID=A0A9P7Z1B7_9HELO|nr:centromere kinetochore component CENP-T-domain-containing protein [Calycina marina]
MPTFRRSPLPQNHNSSNGTVDTERKTPRTSRNEDPAAAKQIPYGSNKLASLPKPTTPPRRASSAGPPSQKSLRRTPGIQARTPGAHHLGSTRRPIAVTPHGRAAIREVEARRAGLTPGKDRRRSGRQQRESPRDALRVLSRLLAPKTQPVIPTPPARLVTDMKRRKYPDDDLDDDAAPERPRLSMPLEDSDEDDSLLLPPRSAGVENEDYTGYSIEIPRRAVSEQAPGRYSRGSFGSVRLSDQFANLNEAGRGHVFDSSFAMGGAYDDENGEEFMDNYLPREDTVTLRNLGFDIGRQSDIRPQVLTGDDMEDTFVLTVPPRDVHDLEKTFYSNPPIAPNDENEASIVEESLAILQPMEIEEEEEELFPEVYDPEQPESPAEVDQEDMEVEEGETTVEAAIATHAVKKRKKVKISKHGIRYPSLPAVVVKKLATMYARTAGNSKAKISKDTLDAIMQASDWFLEQVSEDLGAYAKHAGRKTIDESDMMTLMKRQRQTNATTTAFSLAQRHLPRELLQELRMAPPPKLKKGRRLVRVDEEEEEQ